MPDDSVVGLLHLAQAAERRETFMRLAPSVVVALLERLEHAEDAAVLLAANLTEACDALGEATDGHVSGYEPDILNWREMAAGVTGTPKEPQQ